MYDSAYLHCGLKAEKINSCHKLQHKKADKDTFALTLYTKGKGNHKPCTIS